MENLNINMENQNARMENQNINRDNIFNEGEKYLLKLYISGSAPRSITAVNRITELCKTHLDNYELRIIDVYEKPDMAKEDQIIAIPTLVKSLPFPERRLIGDMIDINKVLAALGLNN